MYVKIYLFILEDYNIIFYNINIKILIYLLRIYCGKIIKKITNFHYNI